MVLLLALLLLMPLTACGHTDESIANDPGDQCEHPDTPDAPYTDKKVGILITEQSEVIDTCRSLLGHPAPKVAK